MCPLKSNHYHMKTSMLLLIVALLFVALSSDAQEKGSLTDSRDGKTYHTIKIGEQTWMAENLNYAIQRGCACYKDDTTNCDKFGRLYRWEAAKISCPSGWHLPSDGEWGILVDHLGGKKVAGGKLQAAELWEEPNSELTNLSGFCALPAGQAVYTGVGIGGYMGLGKVAVWWTSTKPEFNGPIFIAISEMKNNIIRKSDVPNSKYSVRCIQNN